MKTFYNLCPKSIFFTFCLVVLASLNALSQTCSVSTVPGNFTTKTTIANTAGISFAWTNTSTIGQFQKNNSTTITSPVMSYPGAVSSVSFAYDLTSLNPGSTVTSYTITLIYGPGGSLTASCTGGSFNVTTTQATYYFTISGISLNAAINFQVKLSLTIGSGQKDINTANFKSNTLLASTGSGLPVEIIDFTGKRDMNKVILNWTTMSESSTRGFEIQRRYSTQSNFETVAFVNSKALYGTSSSTLNYSYTDANSSPGVSYYRLKQVDINGQFKFSIIRSVDGSKTKAQTLVYPNPAVEGSTNIVFSNDEERNIRLTDISGHVVKNWNNYNNPELKIGNLKPGLYLVQINNTATNVKEFQRIVVTQ